MAYWTRRNGSADCHAIILARQDLIERCGERPLQDLRGHDGGPLGADQRRREADELTFNILG